MKKYIFIIVAVLLGLSACDMYETPKASVGKDAMFSSESGLKMYTNSMYDVLPGSGMTSWGETNENVINAYQGARTRLTASYTADMEGKWGWGTLRNINYFLDNNTNPNVDEKVRNNYSGIARFWRAVFYFDKIRTYNDVPWIDHALDLDDELLHAGRDPRSVVAEHIYEDLQFAIENITAATNATGTIVTSLLAAGEQSRFCLWEGTFRKYHNEPDADKWLKRAADAAKIVMDSKKYSLNTSGNTPYRDLFITKTPKTNEVMLATVYSVADGLTNGMNRKSTASTLGTPFCPTRQFMNLYLNLDGTRYTDDPAYKTDEFMTEFTGRDKRIAQTIRVPGTKRSNGAAYPDWQVTFTGYMGMKFCTDDANLDGMYSNENNYIWMRYAEVLLNYAEAKAELGTLTDAEWAATIGLIRARAGITGGLNAKPTTVDKYLQETFFPNVTDATILEVRRERMIELVWEATPSSFADVQRWKVGPLLGMKWQGIYVKEFDKNIDLDLDGTPDVYFFTSTKPTPEGHVVYVDMKNSNWSVDTDGHTILFTPENKFESSQWVDRAYFHPISTNDLALNPNLGQNSGY